MLTDRSACKVVDAGILIAETLYRLYPQDFQPDKLRHLLLSDATLEAIKAGKPLKEIRAGWQTALDDFEKRRTKYLIYK